MNRVILTLVCTSVFCLSNIYTQHNLLEVEGPVKIGNTVVQDPVPGTIRFNGSQFEGWDGLTWVVLGGYKIVDPVTDYDGNVYRSVQIGDQIWMAENLRVTYYNDGSTMQIKIGLNVINSGSPGTLYYPEDLIGNAPAYGALYDYFCVETNKICPVGWHVPNDSEWQTLVNFLGGNAVAGDQLKEIGDAHWFHTNQASNTSGFTARGAGRRHESGNMIDNDFLSWAYFWSSSVNNLNPSYWNMSAHSNSANQNLSPSKSRGCSIRCIKN